ncbi:MAG: hypothetical protein IPJ06_19445 [Saprospiraceae bacterium]|nr:hypothetical protein [Saprospiraceae bacterium]
MKISICATLVFLCTCAMSQENTRPSFQMPNATGMQINTYTGNVFYSRSDLYLPGRGIDVDLEFYYNSQESNKPSLFGKGWSYQYNIQMLPMAEPTGSKIIKWGNGREEKYIKTPNGFVAPAGNYNVLTEMQTGYVLQTKERMKYFFEGSERNTKIKDQNGNALTFQYPSANQWIINDASGRDIVLIFQNGLLSQVVEGNENPIRTWTYSYNNDKQLISSTDPVGSTIAYSYGRYGWMVQMTDQNNNTTRLAYNPDSYVRSIVTCETKHEFIYNRVGKSGETLIKEQVGDQIQVTTYTFDNSGRNTNRTGNCCGNDASYIFDSKDRIVQFTDANGLQHSYEYDSLGNQTKIIDPMGCVIEMTYDLNFNQTTFKDKNGNTTNFTYDNKGNLSGVARPLNMTESYTYDAFGNQISHTDARGNTTTYEYNTNGYLIQINHPVGGLSTQFSYDNRGNKLTQTDGNGHVTRFKYDVLNRFTELEDPLGNKTLYQYDARGNKTMETNALGNAIEYIYDGLDRLIEVKAPLNVVTKYAYDSRGNLLQQIDPRGSVTNYTYDSRNFLVSQKDPLGFETTYTYDGIGNQTSVTDPNNNTTQYTYDNLNRLTKTTDALGFETNYEYDCNGNPKKVIDANGNATSYTYDALNRQTSIIDALGFTTYFEFDKNNNLIKITDAKGNPTSYDYDALNRKTKETFADNTTKMFTYDGVGNVSSRKDNAGNVTFYTYDPANRLTLRNYPDTNDDHFSYDALGRMIEATNQNATVNFTYDALNRILSETLNGKVTGYAYNSTTGKRTLIYPSGRVIEEFYDVRNQLAGIKESNNILAAFSYDPARRMTTRTYGNGTVTAYTYDNNNRVTRILANPGGFLDFRYDYDKVCNKLYEEKKHHSTHSEEYGYDAKYQLTSFKVGALTGEAVPAPITQTTYNYDALGNRVTVVKDGNAAHYTSNNLNQYTVILTEVMQNLSYDLNGSLLTEGNSIFEYNFDNQLTKNIYNTNVQTFKYDALGRLAFSSINNIESVYCYDEARVIELYLGNANAQSFIYGYEFDEIILLALDDCWYLHQNQISSTTAISNSEMTILDRFEYDAFGLPIFYDDNFQETIEKNITNLFTGRNYFNSQIYFLRNRFSLPVIGRFIQRDKIRINEATNLYTYADNDPINKIDPFGLRSKKKLIKRVFLDKLNDYILPDPIEKVGQLVENSCKYSDDCYTCCQLTKTLTTTSTFTLSIVDNSKYCPQAQQVLGYVQDLSHTICGDLQLT